MELFPIFVKLAGRRCVVVGAGEIGAGKIETLLACGAVVHVIAPHATSQVQEQANAGKLAWEARLFKAGDLDRAFLAVAATSSSEINEQVYAAARDRGVLCNVVDDPERCDFYYPAVVHRGALQIAISTGGHSPALARRLREELEQQFGPEYAEWLNDVGRRRREILAQTMPESDRRALLEQIASPDAFQQFLRSRDVARK